MAVQLPTSPAAVPTRRWWWWWHHLDDAPGRRVYRWVGVTAAVVHCRFAAQVREPCQGDTKHIPRQAHLAAASHGGTATVGRSIAEVATILCCRRRGRRQGGRTVLAALVASHEGRSVRAVFPPRCPDIFSAKVRAPEIWQGRLLIGLALTGRLGLTHPRTVDAGAGSAIALAWHCAGGIAKQVGKQDVKQPGRCATRARAPPGAGKAQPLAGDMLAPRPGFEGEYACQKNCPRERGRDAEAAACSRQGCRWRGRHWVEARIARRSVATFRPELLVQVVTCTPALHATPRRPLRSTAVFLPARRQPPDECRSRQALRWRVLGWDELGRGRARLKGTGDRRGAELHH